MEGRTLGRRVACCGFCLSLLVAGASGLLAQSDPDHENQIGARGFSPEKLYNVADLDAINLFNGNLTLAIPIGQTYPVGPGLSYQLTLVYNSLVWDLQETYRPPTNSFDTHPVPSGISNAGLGWTLTLGELFAPGPDAPSDRVRWTYVSPDGGRHLFYDDLHENDTDDGDLDDNVNNVLYTRDNTYIRMTITVADNEHVLEMADGTIHTFRNHDSSGGNDWRLESIRDRYGHELALAYIDTATGRDVVLTDSRGREHRIVFVDPNEPDPVHPGFGLLVDRVVLETFGGQPATYELTHANLAMEQCYRNTNPDVPINDLIVSPVLTEVSLPADGGTYVPGTRYATTCGSEEEGIPGALGALTLPTKGELEWDYGKYWLPGAVGPMWQVVSGVVARRMRPRTGGPPFGERFLTNEIISTGAPTPRPGENPNVRQVLGGRLHEALLPGRARAVGCGPALLDRRGLGRAGRGPVLQIDRGLERLAGGERRTRRPGLHLCDRSPAHLVGGIRGRRHRRRLEPAPGARRHGLRGRRRLVHRNPEAALRWPRALPEHARGRGQRCRVSRHGPQLQPGTRLGPGC